MKLVNIRYDHEEGLWKAKQEEEKKLAQNRQKYEEMLMSFKWNVVSFLKHQERNCMKVVEGELRKSEDKLALNISLARSASEIGE